VKVSRNDPERRSGKRIICRYGAPVRISSRLVLWCWRNNGGTWTLLKPAFTSYFLSKVSY